MIYYFLLFLYFLLAMNNGGQHSTPYRKRQEAFLCFFPLFLLTALRSNTIGVDTMAYYNAFNGLKNADSVLTAISSSSMEPGYVGLSYILAHLGASYYVMQILISFFIYHSLSRFVYRYSDNVAMSVFVFLASNSAFGAMNVVRMWIVVAILLYSIESIQNKNIVRFILIIAIASLFHYSALLFIAMYPLCNCQLTRTKKMAIIVACIIVSFAAGPFFTFVTNIIGRYGNYVTGARFNTKDNLSVKVSLMVNLCFYLFAVYMGLGEHSNARGKERMDAYVGDTIQISYISYVAMLLAVGISIIGLSNTMMGRTIHYFSVFMLILIPEAMNKIKSNYNRAICFFVIMGLLFIKYAIVMALRPEWYHVTPYQFFFLND